MPPNRPSKALSEEIVGALRGEISGQISSAISAQLSVGISTAVKSEVAVLSERIDGQRAFLEEKFRHIEQRQETDARSIGVRLDRDTNEIKGLAEDVKTMKTDISTIRQELGKSSVAGERVKELEKGFTEIGDKLEQKLDKMRTDLDARLKPLEEERIESKGIKKTLSWLWSAVGASILTGIGALIYIVVKNS